jgi:hypothetical protein
MLIKLNERKTTNQVFSYPEKTDNFQKTAH